MYINLVSSLIAWAKKNSYFKIWTTFFYILLTGTQRRRKVFPSTSQVITFSWFNVTSIFVHTMAARVVAIFSVYACFTTCFINDDMKFLLENMQLYNVLWLLYTFLVKSIGHTLMLTLYVNFCFENMYQLVIVIQGH